MCSVTGVQYATVHDMTAIQVSAHQSSKINSVLFGLPATCRSFNLIYPPSRSSLFFVLSKQAQNIVSGPSLTQLKWLLK